MASASSSEATSNDPLTLLLNGREPSVAPVAPVYEGLGPLEFHRMELRWQKWRARLEAAGVEALPVDYGTYFDLELEIHRDILEGPYPRPTWLALPWNATPEEVEGCSVARRGGELFWVEAEGEESWMAPNREAHEEAFVADRSHHFARLWERGREESEVTAREESPAGGGEPSSEEAEAALVSARYEGALVSARYEMARALLGRYPDELPLYLSESSPYNSLLGRFGFQGMMYGLTERREEMHRVLESWVPRPSARAEAERKLGVGIVFVEECLASADVISPQMYLEFCFPYTKRMLEFYEERGFRTVLYFSGNLMPLLKHLRELPFTALSFEEDRKGYGIDLAEVRRVMGPERVLFGNADAPFVESASDEDLLAEVRRQLAVGGAEGNFVVSIGSPFTPKTSLERVRLFCESTRLGAVS